MPNIKDVANVAGVSVTTVSRILNNRGYISSETRQRIYDVMEQLDYHPNEIARSLFRQRSNIIGLIIPNVSHPFFSEITSHLEYYAYENGMKILLCNSNRERNKEKGYIDMLRRSKVDGIILGSHSLAVDEYIGLKLPVVTLDRQISDGIPYVSSDNYEGGRLATSLLIQKGCRKIAHISGNLSIDLLANKRYEGFISVAKERNIPRVNVQADLKVYNTNAYEKIVTELFQKHPDIDGVFASSDVIAANAIKVCHKLHKRIPEDVKIIGYDDVKLAALVVPAITTIRQPMAEMSRLAVEILIDRINGKDVNCENVLPVTLVERDTT